MQLCEICGAVADGRIKNVNVTPKVSQKIRVSTSGNDTTPKSSTSHKFVSFIKFKHFLFSYFNNTYMFYSHTI